MKSNGGSKVTNLRAGTEREHRGGRPRRDWIVRNITVQVEPDTHSKLHELAKTYGVSLGRMVDMMTSRAARRLAKKKAQEVSAIL